MIQATLPDDVVVLTQGISLPLPPLDDLGAGVLDAVRHPLDTPPLGELAREGSTIAIAFDDPTVPCYAPLWATALPLLVEELRSAGVRDVDMRFICANALHRQFTLDELSTLVGPEFVREHEARIRCHDAEDHDAIQSLGTTNSGLHVELNRAVCESDLTIYLNCSTTRGFSGGWKSVCVGLSTYRSIAHHHTPEIMSMSIDRNEMHKMLDEMGTVVEEQLGSDRIFKLETVLANPFAVHRIFGGTVGATRSAVLNVLRSHQPPRRDLIEELADVVVYGVPEWSPYAAFSHNNPILDLISTGLGYLGGMIEAAGKPGCTVVLATPCRNRWDEVHHASYPEVWRDVIPITRDPDEARRRFEPELAARADLVDKYRRSFSFHPVHAVMALYPLKRLRHAGRVIVVGAEDPTVPLHVGFEVADSIERALDMAAEEHGPAQRVVMVDNPMAFNRA
ncbi:MAG: lactate racemase domain-containing protein [Actinomycetota bacterium]|nr:lactate racemase domain-containing protein [Actinomycetota bacterium]